MPTFKATFFTKTTSFNAFASTLLVSSLVACGGGSGSSDNNIDSDGSDSEQTSLNIVAKPNIVQKGQLSTISWQTENSVSCQAKNDWTTKTQPKGSATVGPMSKTTVFTMSCFSKIGEPISESITVKVDNSQTPSKPEPKPKPKPEPPSQNPVPPTPSPKPPKPAPVLDISANPSTITEGESTVISWSSENIDSCAANGGWSNNTATSGTQPVGPLSSSQEFTITCVNSAGEISKSVLVTVEPNISVDTAELSWTPPTTNENGTSLTDLAGYTINYGTMESNLNQTITINNPGVNSYIIENLTASSYYFVVKAFDSSGNESNASGTVSKAAQ